MPPGRLKYVVGDATQPDLVGGYKMIPHVCNDIGVYGAGFALALSKRWKSAEVEYKRWFANKTGFKLGEVQLVDVSSDVSVINMIAQKGIVSDQNPHPLDYKALESCLIKTAKLAQDGRASLHCPKFGAGLAGGNWEKIEEMIRQKWILQGLNVTVYTLGNG